jgi:hypothetical protein
VNDQGKRLPPDIESRIDADFASADRSEARRILAALQKDRDVPVDRVQRSIVFLAKGDLERLADLAGRAGQDARDVIYWAEYDALDKQVRDFTRPFPES